MRKPGYFEHVRRGGFREQVNAFDLRVASHSPY
jgi:hypothetical protein